MSLKTDNTLRLLRDLSNFSKISKIMTKKTQSTQTLSHHPFKIMLHMKRHKSIWHTRDVDVMEIHIQFHFIHDVLSEE